MSDEREEPAVAGGATGDTQAAPTPPITKPPPADRSVAPQPVASPADDAASASANPPTPPITKPPPADRLEAPPAEPVAPAPARPPLASPPTASPGPPVIIEPPSPDVALVGEAPRLPGEHRGGFGRLPTAPVDITPAPVHPADAEWAPTPAPPPRTASAWALACSIIGLGASLVVGWAFPIGLIGIVLGIVALRRPLESSAVAAWAIALGTLSVLYSAGWLIYAAWEVGLIG